MARAPQEFVTVMQHPRDTLVVLVTCSRDETRRDLAVQVTQNLAMLIPQAGLQDSFVIFDNASSFKDHLQYAPKGAVIVQPPENVGYWSAIKWVLEQRGKIFDRMFKYIYLVESDLTHSDLRPLGVCEAFLDATSDAACVRTQEFSVRQRWRFAKNLKFLPFHVTRSEIHLKNAVTGDKAWFKPASTFPPVYLSNLHAKLPALNRLAALDAVFAALAGKTGFTECDFFTEMHKSFPHIGVLDGGLFHSLNSRHDACVSGSYSNAQQLDKVGYQQTRSAHITPVPGDLGFSRMAS